MASNEQKVASFQLAAEIQKVIQGQDIDAALSALNYCMASLIHLHMDGSDEALENSDEQTRWIAEVLRTERHH